MADFVDDARGQGYSDEEISNYLTQQRAQAKAAGYDDHAIDDYLTGVKMPRTIPDPFLQRFAEGHPASFVMKQTKQGFSAAGGSAVSPEIEGGLRYFGIWNDPEKGQASPLRFANEAVMRPIISGVQTVMSLFNAGIAGAGALAAQAATGQPAPEKTANEMAAFGGIAAMLLGTAPYPGPITKPHLGPMGEVSDLKIGDLPTHQTVVDAAKALGGPDVPIVAKDKLVTLYEGKGLHPSEVVDDASRDPTVKQSVLSINQDHPYGVIPGEPPLREVEPAAIPIHRVFTGEGPAPSEAGKPQGMYVSIAERPEFESPHAEGARAAQSGYLTPTNPLEVPEITVDHARGGGLTIPASAGVAALKELSTPEEFGALLKMNKQQIIGQIRNEFPDLDLGRQIAGGDHDAYEMLEILGAQRAKAAGYDAIILRDTTNPNFSEAVVLDPSAAKFGAATNENIARFNPAAAPRPDVLREAPRYTTEPDHEAPGQYVAKDETGRVVAVGDTPEQAVQLAQTREGVPAAGAGGPPALPPEPPLPGGIGGEEPPRLPPPLGPTIEHEGPKPPPISYDDARKAVLDRLSIGEPDAKRPWSFSRLYTNLIDQLYPLSRATIRAAGKLNEPLSTASNPEHLARLLSGASGKAEHFLKFGTVDFDTYAVNGPSLESILKPLRGDELNDFRAYVAGSRALELGEKNPGSNSIAVGIETGIPLDAAERVVDEGFSKYAGIHGQLVDYQNRLAQYLRDSGVVSQKGYEAMVAAHQNYVPFFRLFDEEEGFRPPGGSLQATNPIHRIKGSESRIIDPLESIIKNTYLYTQMAERNAVGTTLIDLLKRANETTVQEVPLWKEWPAVEQYMKELGIKNPEDLMAFVQTAAETPEGNSIAVLRDGRRETYRVDPELARAFKGLDRDTMNMLTRMLQIPASYLRAGAVLTPDFMFRHILRDYQYAVITAKGLFTPADMARGFAALISKDPQYQNWLKSGGANISIAGIDRNYLQESIANLTRTTGLGVRAQNVVDLLTPQMDFATKDITKQLLHPLQVGLELAQSATHLGAFIKESRRLQQDLLPGEQLTKPMIQAAGYESRATGIDPSRIGASMKAWNAITAFGNIALQDSDRIVRAFIDKPMATSIKVAGALTLPSVLLWWANHDDPDWQQISQWQKDLFWIIPTWRETGADGKLHKVFMRPPKPWATGLLFASLPERLLQNFLTDNPTSAGSFLRSLMETTGIGLKAFTPTGASPILDQLSNENLFSGRTLIPQSMEKLLPEYQYTQYTTETARRLGQSIAPFAGQFSSPILLENYLRGWTGTMGNYILGITDSALRKQGVLPDPPLPTRTLADMPFIRAFSIRYPNATTQSIEDFNTEYQNTKRYFDTFMAKAKEGDQEAMARIQALGGPQMFVQLGAIHEALLKEQQVIRNIYKDPSMKPEEKRQFIDRLYFEMIDVARQGRDTQKAIARQFER